MKPTMIGSPFLAALALASFAQADTIPYQVARHCSSPYEHMERDWDSQRTLQTWTGMSDLMSACSVDSSLAAKSIDIVVDKAGLDQLGRVPSPGGVRAVAKRLFRIGRSKQWMHVRATLLNGQQLSWKFVVSTGNDLSDGADNPKASNMTPSGTYDLGRVNDRIAKSQQIQNSQAYCVEGKQYSYVGTPMPYAIFFKSGYAIHSGVVTGVPESHGCVRVDPQNVRKLYCLLRQKTELADQRRKRTAVTENFRVAKLRICENLSKGCDENGNTTN